MHILYIYIYLCIFANEAVFMRQGSFEDFFFQFKTLNYFVIEGNKMKRSSEVYEFYLKLERLFLGFVREEMSVRDRCPRKKNARTKNDVLKPLFELLPRKKTARTKNHKKKKHFFQNHLFLGYIIIYVENT